MRYLFVCQWLTPVIWNVSVFLNNRIPLCLSRFCKEQGALRNLIKWFFFGGVYVVSSYSVYWAVKVKFENALIRNILRDGWNFRKFLFESRKYIWVSSNKQRPIMIGISLNHSISFSCHILKIVNLEHTFNFCTIITHVKRETEPELKYIMVDLKAINLVLR